MRQIGIYHQIDLEVIDRVASLVTKGASAELVNAELDGVAFELGIKPRTAKKRTRPARKAWFSAQSPTVRRAIQLYPKANRDERLALHVSVLIRAYPFIFDVMVQVGTLSRLGSSIHQSTVRDRLTRRYGPGGNVKQGVRKVLQTLVSWGLLEKAREVGVYEHLRSRPIQAQVAEVLLAGMLEVGDKDALAVGAVSRHPAFFPFKVVLPGTSESYLLGRYTEGTGDVFVQLAVK